MQLGAALRNFSSQLASSFQVVQLRAGVEVHHLGVGLVVIVDLRRLHGFIHHLSDLEHLFDSETLSLIETLRVQSDAGSLGKQGADLFDEFDTVFSLVDIVGDVGLGIVAEGKPVEDICHKCKVWLTEVLHRDVSSVTKCAQDLRKVPQLTIRHVACNS